MAASERKPGIKSKATTKRKSKKKSTGITRKRIRYDSKFERTRENNAEFLRANKAVKLIRSGFREKLKALSDRYATNRLTQVCVSVLNGDLSSGRGERTVNKGELDRLRYYNFNHPYSFFSTLFTRNTYSFNRASGVVTASIPAYSPAVFLDYPKYCTHYAITAVAFEADFDAERLEHAMLEMEEIKITDDLLPAQEIALQLTANSPWPVVLIMCIRFLEKEDGRYYIRKEDNANAATIVEVFKP